MLEELCISEVNRIRKSSIEIEKLRKSIEYKKVTIFDEKERIEELQGKILLNYKRDLQCKTISCNTEIEAIEDELINQLCIRLQRLFRKEKKRHDLLSLDEIRQYQRYKTHLNKELINTRLEKLLYSEDLQIFRNNYLTNHIESINTSMSKYNKSIIDNERNIKKLNKVVDSSYELLCKLALKMNIYGIMKIQGQIKLLKEFPRHQELLDDFTKNYSYY